METEQAEKLLKPLCKQKQQQLDLNEPNDSKLRHMCEYCGYRTDIAGNLVVHKRRHTGEKPFRCGQCDAVFVARYQLATHSERHLDAHQRRSRYKCDVCGFGFLSSRALYHHRPLHAPSKRFKCALCEKSYSQAAGYAQHKRWHRQRNERLTAITPVAKTDEAGLNEHSTGRL